MKTKERDALIGRAELAGLDPQPIDDYSGRGMFGATVAAVKFRDRSDASRFRRWYDREESGTLDWDNLGYGYVFYRPDAAHEPDDGETYRPLWSAGEGRYQADYDRLYEALVPKQGEAATSHGELLRISSKLYYDRFNNGCCNYDVYEDERHTLLGSAGRMEPTAVALGVRDFRALLRDFCRGRGGDAGADQVVDVIVCYARDCEVAHAAR